MMDLCQTPYNDFSGAIEVVPPGAPVMTGAYVFTMVPGCTDGSILYINIKMLPKPVLE